MHAGLSEGVVWVSKGQVRCLVTIYTAPMHSALIRQSVLSFNNSVSRLAILSGMMDRARTARLRTDSFGIVR